MAFPAGFNMCYVQKDRNTILVATHKNGLYHVRVTPDNQNEAALATVDINLLHRRMGHISTNRIQHMVKSGQLQGIDTLVGTSTFCEACVLGKMKKLPFESQEQPRTTRPFEMIHMNAGGSITPRSREGYRFWIVIMDDFTCFPWVYFMEHKNEALQIYNQWNKDVQTVFQSEVGREDHFESYVKWVCSDRGTKYVNKAFQDQLKTDGTLHETSAPYMPEQNGLTERMNHTMSALANTMLEESKLPKSFWANAMAIAAYVTVLSPASGIDGNIPYQVLFNQQVDPTLFRPFGCPAYVYTYTKGTMWRKILIIQKEMYHDWVYIYGQQAYKLLDIEHQTIISS